MLIKLIPTEISSVIKLYVTSDQSTFILDVCGYLQDNDMFQSKSFFTVYFWDYKCKNREDILLILPAL